MGKKRLELPPALQTRTANHGRVVGAPDMPRAKRSSQEVATEKAHKEKAAAETEEKRRAALERIAAIEEASGENDASIRTLRSASQGEQVKTAGRPSSDPQERAGNDHKSTRLTLKLRLPQRRQENTPINEGAHTEDIANADECIEERGVEAEEAAGEHLAEEVDGLSSDEYKPEQGEGGSEGEDEVSDDAEDEQAEQARTTNGRVRGKAKVGRADVEKVKLASRNASALNKQGVGKRKPEDARHVPNRQPVSKKSKTSHPLPSFVSNWESILETQVATPARELSIPRQKVYRRSTSVASLTTSGAAPPSSSANSLTSDSEDGAQAFLNSGGYADDENDDSTRAQPHIDTAAHTSSPKRRNVTNYREREDYSQTLEIAQEDGSQDTGQGVTLVQDMLTKVVVRTSTLKAVQQRAAAPTVTPAPGPKGSSKSMVTVVAGSRTTASSKESARIKSGSTATGSKVKSHMSDLASVLRVPFNTRFVPLVRQYLGVLMPWEEISLAELQKLHRKAFGNELAREYPLQERDHCYKLIGYRINDWRSKFASTAVATFEEIISGTYSREPPKAEKKQRGEGERNEASNMYYKGQDDEDERERERKDKSNGSEGEGRGEDEADPGASEEEEFHFTTPESIGIYADFLLGDAKKAAPFYWLEWNNGLRKKGRLQSDMIVGTFAYHLAELLEVDQAERISEFPVGALTMAVLGVRHALTHYTTGRWEPPDGRPGYFSEDNYGDTFTFKDGKYVLDERMTRILKVVKDLSDAEWTEIYTSAYNIVKRRATPKGRRRGKSSKQMGTVGADTGACAHAASSDDDLMLVADVE
ncbi:hypothetical protein BN946_scf184918.g3 [Trametes cinnabarina]|uniref:Uncharacterized protein n=1 Tax=Pycnoporus cinnabarinus TaxID=5643 RepID=A0A060SUE5_PYCCI|nr:hypothetical protein BN946_scf184918.g3 [Trametes cinnabarina]